MELSHPLMEPLFPFSFPNRELRQLRQLADQMENRVRASDGTDKRVPNYEYHREQDKILLEVELPGVQKEQVGVEMRGSNLCISGRRFKASGLFVEEHKDDAADNGGTDSKVEEGKSASMIYELQVKVGDSVDENRIKAEHKDGLLKMMIPLKTHPGSRKIAITQG
ncbi:unnamed protein product [Agarophyton chilense]